MNLNSQIQKLDNGGGGGRGFIFKEGVKIKYMSGKDPIVFKILPSFDPGNPDPATSVLPFALADGTITDWGTLLYITRFAGHGKGGYGTRQDLISMRSFAVDGQEVFCPIDALMKTINTMPAEWGYLIADRGEGQTRERKAFSKPLAHFITNVYDLNQPTAPAQVGMFTSSASRAITDPKNGLIFQRTNLPEEVLATNYLLGYQVGDLTNPTDGPALICAKGNENGEFSKYQVTLATDSRGQVVKRAIGPEILATRYNMADPASFIQIPTEESLIEQLISLFNMRSPQGHHEYALLKQAFPQFRIPDAPSAPGASPTVAGGTGFGQAPAAPAGGYAPPAGVAPAQDQLPGLTPTAAAPVTPGPMPQGAPQGVPAAQGAPVQPQAPAGVPVVPQPAQTPPEAQGAEANMAAAAQGTAPVAPGDPVAGTGDGQAWNRESFMERLKTQG